MYMTVKDRLASLRIASSIIKEIRYNSLNMPLSEYLILLHAQDYVIEQIMSILKAHEELE